MTSISKLLRGVDEKSAARLLKLLQNMPRRQGPHGTVAETSVRAKLWCIMWAGRKHAVKPSQRRILTINTRHEHEHRDYYGVECNNVPESQLKNASHWQKEGLQYRNHEENGIQVVKRVDSTCAEG